MLQHASEWKILLHNQSSGKNSLWTVVTEEIIVQPFLLMKIVFGEQSQGAPSVKSEMANADFFILLS